MSSEPASAATVGDEASGQLSALERRALELSASGKSNVAIGERFHHSSKWVQRLKKRPEAIEYLAELEASQHDEVRGELGEGMLEAVRTARTDLTDENPIVRARAISFFGSAYERTNFAARQAAELMRLRAELKALQEMLAELKKKEEEGE
jgi:DNA-binding CsgD family transcriptional regulator